MHTEIIITGDGSPSLYVPALDETYHSRHGALQESRHVFIDKGLSYWKTYNPLKSPSILEIGFGTGLNATLAWAACQNRPCAYHTLEPFPIGPDLVSQLHYFDDNPSQEVFAWLHAQPWEAATWLEAFEFCKYPQGLEDFTFTQSYDVIFFDAFAPNKQPALWEHSLLEKICANLNPRAVFVTYCAKGQLKRDLASLGMEVQTLPGPPGKKEMVRALKPIR
ncbi:MAG: tRNA (5-methylaminomethyl-2-thiouridine)(34)-methyltransferase MnmD [Cytophagales bacterium]|nr:tRNA (5-methylaminomethyl-2-thiouridine)(34)-methyltransferase MnmD [Cytophagales bacterium]